MSRRRRHVPVVSRERPPLAAPTRHVHTRRHAAILLIEDDPLVRRGLQLALGRHGHGGRTADTGEAGPWELRASTPDLVVLDLMLPGMDGIEVCRRIRSAGEVPVIMLTARGDDFDVVGRSGYSTTGTGGQDRSRNRRPRGDRDPRRVRPRSHDHGGRGWVEAWRTSAYLVFAGVLVILAVSPHSTRGLWELVIGQKLFLTLYFPFVIDANEARNDGTVDAVLVAGLIVACVLCRGWLAWSSRLRPEDATTLG